MNQQSFEIVLPVTGGFFGQYNRSVFCPQLKKNEEK